MAFVSAGALGSSARLEFEPFAVVGNNYDGRTDGGEFVGNGTYFIQIVTGKDVQIKRVIVLKR